MPRHKDFRIGVISDTHGLLRPEAVDALRKSDLILHAGDIGAPNIIPALREIASVIAIRGNIDEKFDWAAEFPETEIAEAAGLHFYMLHSVDDLDLNPRAAEFAAVISGHSHKPEHSVRDGVLYFNPGSAGPRRFSLPISVGRITIRNGKLIPELITLEVKK
jgi:putative phosphoesterase